MTYTVGIIGLGAMGRLYAEKLSSNGFHVLACDTLENYDRFKSELQGPNIEILKDGHLVTRRSDYTIYSVEASNIEAVVAKYGPSAKMGSIVGGQTSCKAPEIDAFEKYLPADVSIIPIHSMHGPSVSTVGQPLAIVPHRLVAKDSLEIVKEILDCFKSRLVIISAKEHDKIAADVQAATHMAFLSMGTAWMNNKQYPWVNSRLCGGLENAKINIALRIYSNSWHVYAGLAITNPQAHVQTVSYAKSVTDLLKLMISNKHEELRERLYAAKRFVFQKVIDDPRHSLLLSDDLLGRFSLSNETDDHPKQNSHLSILAIADCWYHMKIIPYDHMICSTPLFRILLGITEFLFMTPNLLDNCIADSLSSYEYRGDDVEFVVAARSWSEAVQHGDFEAYRLMFEETQKFFKHMFPEASKIGNEMIKAINEYTAEQQNVVADK
ncbi:prephenate dehydrogenase (NADP(+)) [Starmerella bacillaris]|uniref:Prephenate dehydrogenase [NADP(+)] n=1 Tax=Starmerella bacillaris TaxID=1247836 RepID=A0AAV5RD65_STABA|nr:prephenate dehydrogenase (NADP(+)) [Starmerella bacillaris]